MSLKVDTEDITEGTSPVTVEEEDNKAKQRYNISWLGWNPNNNELVSNVKL